MTPDPRMDGPRVGLIVPSLNTTTEPDFVRQAPSDIGFFATRVYMRLSTPEDLRGMNAQLDDAARLVGSAAPDLVAYACTSGTFLDGGAVLKDIVDRIGRGAGCPVITTSGAMLDALRAVGASRVAVAAPYPGDITLAECSFLQASGFGVPAWRTLERTGSEIRRIGREEIGGLVRAADHPDAQAIFVSCTDLRAFELVGEMEAAVGKPVLTSNQVTLWAILRALGRKACLPGGRLIDIHL
ncbi:maleate cis-trans isomerase family protein [Mesorhizobium australicum]|uniref:Arylmalonate decarboxylase n=1 Tax=Mesorhizobium australicum TaxID=536018 RepID=A0A1X7MXV7_9HYPH|nr:decarboxylase [Mesorhizobium australicum]SMH29648.1 arylmalonate decarboxylase [Mesorhizobium australicum]